MINLFQIAPQDQSVYYLGQLFGYVGTLLPSANAPLLPGIMFKLLNTTALTIGAFLVLYVTIVGLLKTAQEGEFLGRQWNSLWVPVRTVLGILALFPTSTGYSAIQVIMMWIILQGVGAADTVWSKVIEFIAVTGSPYSAVTSGSLQPTQTQPAMRQLFQGLVCQASMKASYPAISTERSGGSTTIKYYCALANDAFCARSDWQMLDPMLDTKAGGQAVTDKDTYNMGPSGRCGSLTYCDLETSGCIAKKKDPNNPKGPMIPDNNPDAMTRAANSAGCLACKAQRDVLKTIVPTLGAVANKLVAIDNEYAQFYESSTSGGGQIPEWIKSYCFASGYTLDQCCTDKTTCCLDKDKCSETSAVFPSDKGGTNPKFPYSDTSSSDQLPTGAPKSATDFYLQYPLAVYLNGADFINAAVGEYTAALVSALSADIQNRMKTKALEDWQVAAKKYGWILAGGFYYKIAGENQALQTAQYPTLTVKGVTPGGDDTSVISFRNNYTAVGKMLTAMTASNNSSSPGFNNVPNMPTDISAALGASSASMMAGWQENLTNNAYAGGEHVGRGTTTNPLISIATFGYQMMITAQLLFVVIIAAVGIFVGLANINFMVLGTGLTLPPWGEALKAVISLISPFFVILLVALYSIGAMLGIYVPLIPWMVFTVGAIGWLIATIEAMVAAPIVALGILSPGGQHDILGRSEPALMQIFNLFLRPTLMVMGLILSMLLSIAVVNLINTGFLAVANQVISNPGLFEQILFIAIYTSFIIAALNKAFSLIYVVPERVLTWIGGPAVQYGEEQALGTIKQAAEGAVSGITGGAKEAGGGLMGSASSILQAKYGKANPPKPSGSAVGTGQSQSSGNASGGSADGGGGGTGTGAGTGASSGGGESGGGSSSGSGSSSSGGDSGSGSSSGGGEGK